MSPLRHVAAAAALPLLLLLASTTAQAADPAELNASFRAKGQAGLDRLTQTDLQKLCTEAGRTGQPPDAKRVQALQEAALAQVKYPADGQYMGDWKAGEKIAQSGRGFQWNDKSDAPVGGNCYACHQLTKSEIAYGTIGPSLLAYGKTRGATEAMQKYVWQRLWSSRIFNACNAMPQFGANHVLTEQQLKDVLALLLDPKSPVNQ